MIILGFLDEISDYLKEYSKYFLDYRPYSIKENGKKYTNHIIFSGKDTLYEDYTKDITSQLELALKYRNKWLECLNDIGLAVIWSNKYLLNNDDSNIIYAERNAEKDITITYFDLDNYKIRVEIITNKLSINPTSSVENFINGTIDDGKIFNFEIKQDIGLKVNNKFSILLNGVNVSKVEDEHLLDIIIIQTVHCMKYMIDSMINKIFSKYTNSEINDWRGFLNEGIWICR